MGILRSSHSRRSKKFTYHDFSEVALALLTVHTGPVDQLEAGPMGPALS
jgi:hypothetical protein